MGLPRSTYYDATIREADDAEIVASRFWVNGGHARPRLTPYLSHCGATLRPELGSVPHEASDNAAAAGLDATA